MQTLTVFFILAHFVLGSGYDYYESRYKFPRSINSPESSFSHPAFTFMKPIGYLAGEPIWPRTYTDQTDSGELVFDENGAAYNMPKRRLINNILRRRIYKK